MPKIICHECGKERVVVKGKRKNCRGCGAKLTDIQQPLDKLKAKTEPQEEITVEELAEKYPTQVAKIVSETRADMAAGEFGDLTPKDLEMTFPSEVAAIILKATNDIALKSETEKAEHLAAIEKLKVDTKADQEALAMTVAGEHQIAIEKLHEVLAQADKTAKDALKDAVKKAVAEGTDAGRKAVLKMSIEKIKALKQS